MKTVETVREDFDKVTKTETERGTLMNAMLSSNLGRDGDSTGCAMIETVRKNFGKFTKKEIENATLARKIQGRIGEPPDGRFKQILIVCEGAFKHCPVTSKDVDNAHANFGPNLNRLKRGGD